MVTAVTSILVYDIGTLVVSVLGTYANGLAVDYFIDGFNRRKKICILSDEYERIQKYIMQELIRFPQIHMHGPEHHVLVGSALLAACKNCGAEFELEPALLAMRERGSQVPGGICGQWGSCGAGISAGLSLIHI